jgi:glycogen phosphorylase
MEQGLHAGQLDNVLTLEEIANLAAEGGQSAETLMNVVALIAKRFNTDVCSAY